MSTPLSRDRYAELRYLRTEESLVQNVQTIGENKYRESSLLAIHRREASLTLIDEAPARSLFEAGAAIFGAHPKLCWRNYRMKKRGINIPRHTPTVNEINLISADTMPPLLLPSNVA